MFKSWKLEPVQWIFVRSLVGVLWIYLGAEKLFRLPAFIQSVTNYEITTDPMWNTAAGYLVPWLEIVIGFCILARFVYVGALGVNAGMLMVFIAALSQAWVRGLEVSCGCTPWSAEQTTNYPLGIGINIVLLILLGVMAYAEISRPRHRFRGRKLKLT